VYLSKESITDKNGDKYFGTVVALDGYSWDVKKVLGKVTGLSQEHGIVNMPDTDVFDKLNVGDMVAVIPDQLK
jgi:D-serine deaminase-like pyridoxal phosphate-dependent protein